MDSMMMTKCEEQKDKVKIAVPLSLKATSASCSDHAQLLFQNYTNFKSSFELDRCMFYENGSWVDYPSEVAEVMKLRFAEGMPVVEVEIRGCTRLFDFYRMLEIELESGKQRSISWIDVRGKCFFPKVFVSTFDGKDDEIGGDFVSSGDNCPKIEFEIEIKVSENSASSDGLELNKAVRSSKRKREENVFKEKKEESSSNFGGAKKQQTTGTESQSARWPKTRVLGAGEKGYAVVEKLFLSALQVVEHGAKVTAIHQCVRTGPLDNARCQVFAKQMEITKRARGDSNMVFAWYGVSAKGVESILTHGFGMPCEVSNREGPGVGIYLSPVRSPQNSAMLSETDENGEKHVVLCRVILGRCEKVQAGSEQSHPSSIEHDTGVDDLMNPKWYTIWHANMNTHILPECVVSYRPVKASGLVNGMSNMNWIPHPSVMIAKLIAKLKSLLPPPKIQQLGTLCAMFKERKLGKDVFVKQLRHVVGDDILRSTIQEIRG